MTSRTMPAASAHASQSAGAAPRIGFLPYMRTAGGRPMLEKLRDEKLLPAP